MRKLIVLPIFLILSACTTNPNTGEQQLTEGGKAALKETAVLIVERHFREHPSTKVERVRKVLVELQQVPDITTVDNLRASLQTRIDKLEDPYDRSDFTHMLNILTPLLKDYVGKGELAPEAVVRVRDFLSYLAAALPGTTTASLLDAPASYAALARRL